MNCYCLVASALIGSSIATGVLVNYTHYTNFEKSLDEDQTKIYTLGPYGIVLAEIILHAAKNRSDLKANVSHLNPVLLFRATLLTEG